MQHEDPGIQDVEAPTVFSHAPLQDVAPVIAQRRPSKEKLYAAIDPIDAISIAAGTAADGASPNAAIPVGKQIKKMKQKDYLQKWSQFGHFLKRLVTVQ